MNKAAINVTPLIDILLVLLIVFMVVTPMKPSSFKARIPSEPRPTDGVGPNPYTLVVSLDHGGGVDLNGSAITGSESDLGLLTAKLKSIFDARIASGNTSSQFADDKERPVSDRIERTVFIKAPRNIDYGSVTRLIDAVKLANAYPISLQIDGLN